MSKQDSWRRRSRRWVTGPDAVRFRRFVLIVCLAAPALPAGASPAADLAIVDAAVIDATRSRPRENQTILVEGDRISQVGPTGEIEVPAGAQVIDGSGKWVIPGLIDAHVHFFQSSGLFTRPDVIDLRHVRPYPEEIRRIRTALDSTLARYIAAGVTSVIDMGGPLWTLQLGERAAAGTAAPRIATAGPLLGTRAPPELSAIDDPPILHIETEDEARRAVNAILEHDPDFLKVWIVTAAHLASDMSWVREVVAQAQDAGLPVVAHATERRIAAAAVRAEVGVLAHGVEDKPLGQALLAEMLAHDVVYIPTLMVDEGYREVLSGDPELSAIERRLGDPGAISSWTRLPQPRTWPGPAVSAAEAQNLRRAADAGVTIAAGSDAGNIGTLHGPALHRELELMATAAGLTPHEVISAATLGGATAMGRAGDLGTVEEGKLADLVVLDADPLRDIRNTRAIHRVVKGGRVFGNGAPIARSTGKFLERKRAVENDLLQDVFLRRHAPILLPLHE